LLWRSSGVDESRKFTTTFASWLVGRMGPITRGGIRPSACLLSMVLVLWLIAAAPAHAQTGAGVSTESPEQKAVIVTAPPAQEQAGQEAVTQDTGEQAIGTAAPPASAAVISQSAASPARKGATRDQAQKTISMDFDQVDIKVFIKFISELTGKNFVVDDKVRGKVTVLSPTKISLDEAYRVFESVLEVNGFTTVPGDKVIKVVPSVEARQKSVETRKELGFVPKPDDRVITQIKPLRYADSQEIRKLLAPLVSKQGVVVAYDPTDVLIITDFQSNIQRLLQIIDEVDVESREATVTVIPLEYASAEKLAQKISQLIESRQKAIKGVRGAPLLKVVADERMNVLVILADSQNTQMIEGLAKTLDQPAPKGAGNIQVVYLENAQAEELAKVLSGLPTKVGEKGKEPPISTEVKIVADKATNSLVITAKPEEFEVLEPIIQKLDIPRKQVFVEALIMEVSSSRQLSLGVNWNAAGSINLDKRSRDAVGFVGSNPTVMPTLVDPTTNTLNLPTGLAVGAVAFPVTIGNVVVNNLAGLITAAQTDTDFNIISTPQLMTLDNQEATVVVAENIPFSTRIDQGTSTTDRAIQSFEYKDIGVTLKVTPQINEKRFVKLKIYQEVSRVVSQQTVQGVLAPTTRKRKAETLVEVKDGATVVIAGLLGEDSSATRSAVPCLGDIPGLGLLFKSVTRTKDPTNLFVFLTPHIIANPAEGAAIYQQKSRHMDEIRNRSGGQPQPTPQ
jgi:general secretion pathway protein D